MLTTRSLQSLETQRTRRKTIFSRPGDSGQEKDSSGNAGKNVFNCPQGMVVINPSASRDGLKRKILRDLCASSEHSERVVKLKK